MNNRTSDTSFRTLYPLPLLQAQHAKESLLCQRYQILRSLRQREGEVYYSARDLRTQRECSIKFASPRQIHREAELIAGVSHAGFYALRALELEEGGRPFLVGEPITGFDLGQRSIRPMRLASALALLAPIAEGLSMAHSLGVVHRDVRPRQILETHAQEARAPAVYKLAGFNRGKQLDGEPTSGLRIGEPEYLPPEATLPDRGEVDAQSDQWSLAVLFYWLLSGRLPFVHADPFQLIKMIRSMSPQPLNELAPELPRFVGAAIMRSLQKRKEDRFSSVHELMRAITCEEHERTACPQRVPRERAERILHSLEKGAQKSPVATVPGPETR